MTTEAENPLIRTADLPSDLMPHARLVEAIGLDGVLRMCAAHGGSQVYVPANIPISHFLCRLLGIEAAAALSAAFPGEPVFVPNLANFSAIRAASVCAFLRKSGLAPSQIADMLDISDHEAKRLSHLGEGYSPRLKLGRMLRSVRFVLAGMDAQGGHQKGELFE